MASIVIAAHDEAAVIGRCLTALAHGAAPGEFEVVVAANGCHDETAAVASEHGALVLDLPDPGKTAALNAADAVAQSFPRVYLDADMTLDAAQIRALTAAVARAGAGGPLAAAPARHLDLRGRPVLVRAYFAISARLPVYRDALFGRGAVVLSREGRARFTDFPTILADDLFLDGLFATSEKVVVDQVHSVVGAPFRTRDLVARLTRVRWGNAALRAGPAPVATRQADHWSWLRDVVIPQPWLLPAGIVYAGVSAWAAWRARSLTRSGRQADWSSDVSTRNLG